MKAEHSLLIPRKHSENVKLSAIINYLSDNIPVEKKLLQNFWIFSCLQKSFLCFCVSLCIILNYFLLYWEKSEEISLAGHNKRSGMWHKQCENMFAHLHFILYAAETCGYFRWMALKCHCKRTDNLFAKSIHCKPSDSPPGSKSAAHSYRGCGCILSVCVSCNKSYYLLFLLCFFENSSVWASQQGIGLLVAIVFLSTGVSRNILWKTIFPPLWALKRIYNFSAGRLCRSKSGIVQKISWSIEKASIFSLKTRNISLFVRRFWGNH